MKNHIGYFVLIIIFALQNISYSQGETAVPFLVFPVSPSLSGMGATGTSLPTDDPFGFLTNPAQLGYTSRTGNLSFIFYPSSAELLSFIPVKLSGYALNLGYNFKNLIDFPLTVGFGFARPEMSFGTFIRTSEVDPTPISTFESKDYYLAYSLGVGIDYYVQFNAGITYKSVTSILSDQPVGVEQGSGIGEVSVIDYGLLLNVPVIRLIDDNLTLDLFENVPSMPFLNFSIGYAQSNIGDEIYYIDPAQSDPLPRTARLGYGLSTGFDFKIQDMTLRVLSIGFTVDAEDLLVIGRRDMIPISEIEYQSFLGDIDIGRNIIQIKGDENVISRSGFKLDLVETLTITGGKFSGRSFDNRKTNGIEIRAKGLLKLLDKFTSDPTMRYIANHFDIRYYKSNYNIDHFAETNFEGIALVITGFEFW